jgi:Putative zinc-binding metallo-peptidase
MVAARTSCHVTVIAMSEPTWASLADDELLKIRMCDLGVAIEGTELEARIAQLGAELDARGLTFRPYFWLSDEWFTPDGVPGVAIPFYLAHPRLARLELAQMLEVEGADPDECLRILRHEAGHAIDNAYQLRSRPTRRRLFGLPATPYPEYYTPKPYSKSFVQHLDHWYAQSHPDEDFAETFAVWLDPQSMWATRYAGWPAQRKLEYMGRLMRELARRRPRVTSRRHVDPLPRLRKTLGEHYSRKREHYGLDHPDFYDRDLRNLFSDAPEYARRGSAARFVRKIRKEVRSTVASFTDSYQYTIDQLLETIILRCREQNLRLTDSEESTKLDFMVFLTVQTMNYLHSGRHRVAL